MSYGRYEWNVADWYRRQLEEKKIKQSHYDVLSLSYLLFQSNNQTHLNEIKKGMLWYQSMMARYPQNAPIVMGYANLFTCLDSYDEALRLYDHVIQMDQSVMNAYVSKAMIYEYKRVDLKVA